MSILLCCIALRRMTRHKKGDDFWLSGAESFPTVYNMNDFAAIISSLDFSLGIFGLDIHVYYIRLFHL